ncbi:type I restriction enzyme S subunit [Rhodobacter sp. 140A]|nr:type I restriction enzyme S subunit [Rhodobacter sp. 140A]
MSWTEKAIADLGKVVTGKTPPTANRDFYDGQFLFVTPTDLDWRSYFVRSTHSTVTKLAVERLRNQFIPAGSTTFTCIGNTIGKCGITSETCLTNQQINSIVTNAEHDPKFVYYLMVYNCDRIRSIGLGGGAAQPIINKSTFSAVRVRVPDLPTQQRIAGILSAYDDLIENNRRRIGLLEQAARLLYREWFVHLRFPGHETAKIVDGLPEGWSRCVVEDLLVLQRGFDLPVGDRKEGDVPVYGSTGIVGYHNEPKVPAPAIITGRSGSLGQVVISDAPCWPLNTALWVKELKGLPATVGYFLLVSLELEKYNGGASVPTLDRKVVHRLPAVRPSSEVADQFDAIASKSFQTIAKLKTHNLKLTRARDLLLPRLMDGRIPV